MKTIWDSNAEYWYRYLVKAERPTRKYIRPLLCGSQHQEILECGFGSGDLPKFLKRDGSPTKYVGLELTDAFLRKAKTRFDYPFIKGSLDALPFRDNSFDVVYCRHAVEYVKDWRAALKEFRRVARKRVVVIFFQLGPEEKIVKEGFDHYNNTYKTSDVVDFSIKIFYSSSFKYIPRSIPDGEKRDNLIIDGIV